MKENDNSITFKNKFKTKKENMEMYLVIAHGIDDVYYYLLTEEQWNEYKKTRDEDDEVTFDYLNSLSKIIPYISNCDKLCKYVTENDVKLINGDDSLMIC